VHLLDAGRDDEVWQGWFLAFEPTISSSVASGHSTAATDGNIAPRERYDRSPEG